MHCVSFMQVKCFVIHAMSAGAHVSVNVLVQVVQLVVLSMNIVTACCV